MAWSWSYGGSYLVLPVNSNHPPRRIALVDCNNFYASCERVFKPAWNNRPIGVLSNNDGCIIARSNELKDAGIPMGAPFFKYRDTLKKMNAVVVSSNYTLYGDMSSRVMQTLGSLAPDIEIYSIDEAWLDLTGLHTATLDAYGRKVVATTHKNTGIPVSMGIGPTKVLAKIANRICKQRKIPGSVFNIGSAEDLDAVLASVRIGDVWGIGRRWAIKLEQQGIHTALDLRDADPQHMRQHYSVVMERLIRELRGVPCLEFEDVAAKQQIIASRSFGQRVTAKNDLAEALALHATRVGEKLRLQHSACNAIQVHIKTGKHNPKESYYSPSILIKFPVATADTRQLIGATRCGLERIYKQGHRYAKAGVMLLDIVPANSVQGNLFQSSDHHKSNILMGVVDQINHDHGKHTLFYAAEGTRKTWAMKRDKMTASYTTRWDALPGVR